jgi:serine/threonine protein kinase
VTEEQDGVVRIDLTGHSRVVSQFAAEAPPSTLDSLKANYDRLIAQGGVFSPVPYEFVRLLGQGRQGRVYLGRRRAARGCITHHAIKLFDPSLYRSAEEYWRDMGRIASQISQLQHIPSPTMVERHSYEEMGGVGYVIMDLVHGLDLRRLISGEHLGQVQGRIGEAAHEQLTTTLFKRRHDRVSLQPGVVVYIVREVLGTLHRLHCEKFLHSDIKPGNIMVDRFGAVRVIDFGRAVRVGEAVSFLLGSPMYMAPEIHRRSAGAPQSDVYSVGLVALEMLRGQRLCSATMVSEDELLDRKLRILEELPRLLPVDVATNEAFVHVFARCLHPDPSERFPSAEEAASGTDGFRAIERQLVKAELDSEYSRDFEAYMRALDPEMSPVVG